MLDNNPKSDYNKVRFRIIFAIRGIKELLYILFMLQIRNNHYEEKAD